MPEAPANQDKIWAHFQTRNVESFDAARPRLEFLVREIARRASAPPSVLNIGVGSGHFERQALARGWQVWALDPDGVAIERLSAEGVAGAVGYIENLPFDTRQFDFVVASEVVEHLTDAQRSAGLVEVARVLKPGGMFLGTVPFNENLAASEVVCPECGVLFHRWGHQKSFTLETMRAELTAHFEVVELRHTAFVSFADRGWGGKAKSLVRLALGRAGQMIAIPNIYWAATVRPAAQPPVGEEPDFRSKPR